MLKNQMDVICSDIHVDADPVPRKSHPSTTHPSTFYSGLSNDINVISINIYVNDKITTYMSYTLT